MSNNMIWKCWTLNLSLSPFDPTTCLENVTAIYIPSEASMHIANVTPNDPINDIVTTC